MADYRAITIALAGIYQNCQLVCELSRTGACNQDNYNTAITSIFNTEPVSVDAVFGGIDAVKTGLKQLDRLFGATPQKEDRTLNYAFNVMSLALRLKRNPDALSNLSQRIAHASHFKMLYDGDNENLSDTLAEIYSDVISPLGMRIKIIGQVDFLQEPLIQAKIRTALLAAFRSAILWYQVGGNRWNFIIGRNKILQMTHTLLQNN